MTQKNRFFSFVIDFDFFLRCGLLSKCVPIGDVRFATARRLLTTNYTRIENSDSNREKKKYIATRGSRSRLSLEHTYLDCVCVCCYLCAVLYHGTLFFFSSARSEPRQHRINPMDNPFFFLARNTTRPQRAFTRFVGFTFKMVAFRLFMYGCTAVTPLGELFIRPLLSILDILLFYFGRALSDAFPLLSAVKCLCRFGFVTLSITKQRTQNFNGKSQLERLKDKQIKRGPIGPELTTEQ